MEYLQAEFVISNTKLSGCPTPDIPEYAFIGRSNVGKSSLINLLCNNKKLAKTSAQPGKTQLINHFLINKSWYLVDLPGYGYARVSKTNRDKWGSMISNYLLKRINLVCTFLLIDSRIPPQKIDIEFMQWLGKHQLPFVIAFTKTDKLSKNELQKNLKNYTAEMLNYWEEMPTFFITSAISKSGKNEIIKFINQTNQNIIKE
ncbi:MAG: YihA family ribosome biogenesis GTP-binding protein [Bacteroidetes bacterium]|nr:YihA family ribosome biogenesis GTP-binding protein [Bacteroidota bacterium]MBV6461917.1 putative GTP-binding protein EngB [Flavobacteriales bacterium]WKZ74487.1 MAG: ribosome biogenesis GTP-binding protein YihA/YsxC [Vicingaceae bacterium]MCL4816215.1 ribosome biogenesis GTP-binding protein YihA/YsxC [Flavobacteriales bacterium]NOG95101.1 YihA family ribosome biogenesis GTP-binding protein [Bacteroidota bacterium]